MKKALDFYQYTTFCPHWLYLFSIFRAINYFPKSQTKSVCQVEGCNGKHKSLGYCSKHYKRFRSHGDPFLVATTHGEIKTEFCWSTTCRRAYSF